MNNEIIAGIYLLMLYKIYATLYEHNKNIQCAHSVMLDNKSVPNMIVTLCAIA